MIFGWVSAESTALASNWIFKLTFPLLDPSQEVDGDEDGSFLGQLLSEEAKDSEWDMDQMATKNLDDRRKAELATEYGIGKMDLDVFKTKIKMRGNIEKEEADPNIVAAASNLDLFNVEDPDGKTYLKILSNS